MRAMSRHPIVAGMLVATALFAGCDASSVRPPDSPKQYRSAVAEYELATVLPSQSTDGGRGSAWNQPLPAGSPVKATVSGSEHVDIIRVTYPDAPTLTSYTRPRTI